MKFAQLNAFGIPSQVVDCIEGEEPGAPEAGEWEPSTASQADI